ncbi:FAD-dependent oxidoreductase [Acidimangrovimonas sediminis]|uniref:FAD-dependent oxidoreductase n=1 Tax=Acidimangrovimonas sediminis TaxID=2056283 RepID=UPI000C80EAE2|nr:FAD-dependent oxidoreductase [Acidimangrovimonas sediminis]
MEQTASEDWTCDLLVVGSGAGGLSTAVTAAWLGLDVLVVEKERHFGGTTAWSGGWMWIPRNPLAIAAGIEEDPAEPLAYLRGELGEGFDPALVGRFLQQGPRMVSFFRDHTSLDFVDGNAVPDFHAEAPGGRRGGRSLCAAPFDGRKMGARVHDLRPPLAEIAPFGMNIASGRDIAQFLNATRKPGAFVHVARRMLRHFADLARHGRGMHLVNGNALVARLLKSADDLGVRLAHSAPVSALEIDDAGRVTGATIVHDGRPIRIAARSGVVLAAGGFPHDTARKARLFAHAPGGTEHHSAAPLANTGDGLRLGERAGGAVRRDLANAGAWAPVSLPPRRGGGNGRYPHLLERAKPGLIMVRRTGRRFTDEADSYHDVMQALFAATPPGERAEAWLICDRRFLRRYGLGRVRPRPFPTGPWLRNGYLFRGRTPEALARAAGIDPWGLAETLARYNPEAAEGRDPEFHRGESAYNRIQGDPNHGPNPCVAPITRAPFYAVKIVPGSLGTFAGLRTDADARVLGPDGAPVAGLFAAGNDMSSMMAGRYPAGGITLGPAMTFGYVAAHAAAGVPLANNHSPTPEKEKEDPDALRHHDAVHQARHGR